MPVRELPPPPPLDADYPANGYVSRAQEIVGFVICAVIIAMIVGALWAFNRVEAKRTDFIAKCIEFQTWDRCDTLYRYHRQDLMERR